MNVLVTGSLGQLGLAIRQAAAASKDHYIFTDIDELDICSASAVNEIVDAEKVDAIINCAAYTNVEAAEDNPELAERINADAVANLAAATKRRNGLLVHISTDYVFGKESYNTPCDEDMKGTPTGVYGLTKLHGEQAVIGSGCKYVIIRTAWLYSENGRNFVKTMLKLTAEKPSLKVVVDQVGTPTYARDLAKAVFGIVEGRLYEGRSGIYNFSNEGAVSWYDFAQAIASLSGHRNCRIEPCRSDEFPSRVIRPAYSVLDKTKIKQTFGVDVPYWRDSLEECLSKIQQL